MQQLAVAQPALANGHVQHGPPHVLPPPSSTLDPGPAVEQPPAEPSGRPEPKEENLQLPAGRLKKILKAEAPDRTVTPEATYAIGKATELLIGLITRRSAVFMNAAGRQTLQYRDVAEAVASSKALSFLEEWIPRKVMGADLIRMWAQQHPEQALQLQQQGLLLPQPGQTLHPPSQPHAHQYLPQHARPAGVYAPHVAPQQPAYLPQHPQAGPSYPPQPVIAHSQPLPHAVQPSQAQAQPQQPQPATGYVAHPGYQLHQLAAQYMAARLAPQQAAAALQAAAGQQHQAAFLQNLAQQHQQLYASQAQQQAPAAVPGGGVVSSALGQAQLPPAGMPGLTAQAQAAATQQQQQQAAQVQQLLGLVQQAPQQQPQQQAGVGGFLAYQQALPQQLMMQSWPQQAFVMGLPVQGAGQSGVAAPMGAAQQHPQPQLGMQQARPQPVAQQQQATGGFLPAQQQG